MSVARSLALRGARRVVGDTPTPRLLIKGYGEDVAEQLRDLFPTVQRIADYHDVALNEWHALLTTDAVGIEQRSVHTIIIPVAVAPPGGVVAQAQMPNWPLWANISFSLTTKAGIHSVAPGLPEPLAELAARALLPLFAQQAIKRGLTGVWADRWDTWLEPFVLSSDGHILAGCLTDMYMPCWILPAQVGDPVTWVRCAYAVWSVTNPELFPPRADWRRRAEWQTREEIDAALSLVRAEQDFEEARTVFADASAAALTALDAAMRGADLGSRMLLTAQNEELPAAVDVCLRRIGFNVELVDDTAAKGDKLEDLRVTDPVDPDWIALAEVRGYRGGAQVNDLLRISRFVKRFRLEAGRDPSRSWYVVNAFIERDPSEREEPLRSNPNEVATFAGDDGAVIDTRILFRLQQDVDAGRRAPEDARAFLRHVLGVAPLA